MIKNMSTEELRRTAQRVITAWVKHPICRADGTVKYAGLYKSCRAELKRRGAWELSDVFALADAPAPILTRLH